MDYYQHLRQFFGDEVTDDELKTIAVHTIATDVRRLKPAISQAVWDARQQSAQGFSSNASAKLDEARQWHGMYVAALDEFKQITELQLPAEAVAGHDESSESVGRTENDSDRTLEHR
jgi:hypothetical protein